MPFNPYTLRSARVTVQVTRPDANGTATAQTYRFQEHRMRIGVRQAGAQFGNAKIEIFGVPLQTMNQIARLWLEVLTPVGTDTVQIDVWDGQDYVPFFQGVIMWSAVNASRMPHVSLDIEANSGSALSLVPSSPYAVGATPVSLKAALTTIAAQGGFSVQYPDTVTQYQLTQARVTGAPLEQIAQLMDMFPKLTWFTSLQQIVVREALAPVNADAIRVAADTGLMGYPVYSTSGLTLATLFNPKITPGAALDVQTEFDFVNRTVWVAAVLAHTLEPNVPGGQWTTQIAANSYGAKGNGTSTSP
jgi:hypothetical protein